MSLFLAHVTIYQMLRIFQPVYKKLNSFIILIDYVCGPLKYFRYTRLVHFTGQQTVYKYSLKMQMSLFSVCHEASVNMCLQVLEPPPLYNYIYSIPTITGLVSRVYFACIVALAQLAQSLHVSFIIDLACATFNNFELEIKVFCNINVWPTHCSIIYLMLLVRKWPETRLLIKNANKICSFFKT